MDSEIKQRAIKLRKSGRSYRQIQLVLNVPKSTINNWFKDQPWSEKIKIELTKKARPFWRKNCQKLGLARRAYWQKLSQESRTEARNLFKRYFKEQLFIAGLMLYWGEGDNKSRPIVRISNTKPAIVKIFYDFLIRYCGISLKRTKLNLILYKDLDDSKCKRYWSKKVGIPLDRFIKSQYIKGGHPVIKISYGIGILYLTDRRIKEKILEWIRLVEEKFAGIV